MYTGEGSKKRSRAHSTSRSKKESKDKDSSKDGDIDKAEKVEKVVKNKYDCELCTTYGGAVKQTDDGRWAHIVCALWIHQVRLGEYTVMQPVQYVAEAVNHARSRKTSCGICCIPHGATRDCSMTGCVASFHPLCAWYNPNTTDSPNH